ncbi:MAG: hypothetical protein WBW71_05975 [Bacteroidota bacterium]
MKTATKQADLLSTKNKSKRKKAFKVLLNRSYVVDVLAENRDEAMQYVEFYIGNPTDISTESEREKHNFKVRNIEMSYNDAPETL